MDTTEGAAVRIAMTVGAAGEHPGELRTVATEEDHDDGSSVVTFAPPQTGRIAADLTTGADALATAGKPVTPAELAQHFLRAKPADLAEILETLATLGRAHREGDSFTH